MYAVAGLGIPSRVLVHIDERALRHERELQAHDLAHVVRPQNLQHSPVQSDVPGMCDREGLQAAEELRIRLSFPSGGQSCSACHP